MLHSHASLFAQCAIRSFVAIQTSPVQIGQIGQVLCKLGKSYTRAIPTLKAATKKVSWQAAALSVEMAWVCDDHQRVQPLGAVHVVTAKL